MFVSLYTFIMRGDGIVNMIVSPWQIFLNRLVCTLHNYSDLQNTSMQLMYMKAYLLTVPNLVSIQSVCKYTQLDEGKYDLGHICPTDNA
jgi:hypothetical protein